MVRRLKKWKGAEIFVIPWTMPPVETTRILPSAEMTQANIRHSAKCLPNAFKSMPPSAAPEGVIQGPFYAAFPIL